METQTRLSHHNKFISAENIVYSPSRQMTLLHALSCSRDANEELIYIRGAYKFPDFLYRHLKLS